MTCPCARTRFHGFMTEALNGVGDVLAGARALVDDDQTRAVQQLGMRVGLYPVALDDMQLEQAVARLAAGVVLAGEAGEAARERDNAAHACGSEQSVEHVRLAACRKGRPRGPAGCRRQAEHRTTTTVPSWSSRSSLPHRARVKPSVGQRPVLST